MTKNPGEALSDYWLANPTPDLNNLFDLLKLQSAVANFVKIVSGRDIAVEFKVNNSEKSSIDKIIISADLSNIDATVGLAIHETLALIYTPQWLTSKLVMLVNDDYLNRYLNGEISILSSVRYQTKKRFVAEMENIYRLIEYWRLDDVAMRTSPGYKGYIAEAYRYFFCPNDTVGMFTAEIQAVKNLPPDEQKHKYTFRSFLNTLLVQVVHSDNYTDICKNTLDGLDRKDEYTLMFRLYREMKTLLDINNIGRLKSSEDSLNLAIDLWEAIRKAQGTMGIQMQWESGEAMDAVLKAVNLDVDKKAISVSHKEELKLLAGDLSNKNDAHFDGRRIKVVVLKDMNRDMIYSGRYTFFETDNIHYTNKALLEGIRLGNQLARRISFRNNERQTHFSRLQQGKIDKRLLHSVVCGNDAIFYREKEETFPAVNFHISIDGSHSMQGSCFLKSLKTAVAIAQAGYLIKNVNVTISFRFHVMSEGARLPLVLVAYDSTRDKITKIKQLFPFLRASGSTPEGLCYPVISDLIEKNAAENTENYFVNFYDGMPCFIIDDNCRYEGKQAREHVHDEVLRMKRKGIQVLSYFIVSEKWKLEEVKTAFSDCQYMYGKDAKMLNINDLGELAQSLNNLVARPLQNV
ncbi:hypothetical protein AGMMS49965_10150 [Bacteroidia bacterium]|nr:hypothetical protein AGMMS49965_10150 [Bacteroidia bacterium]